EASARRRMLSMACHGLSIPQHAYHLSGLRYIPTTPQHYHEYRQPMTPGHRVAADHSSTFQFLDGRQRQPRQLFACHANNQFPFGSPDVSSTPNNQRSMTSQSPHSSSDNSSLFGSLVDSIPTQHLNEIDLDSSLADLSVLQGSLWDGSGSSITPLDGPDPFEDNGAQPGNPLPDPTSIHMSEQVTSSEFTPNNRFHGNDLQFFNNKPVMLH
uniref:Uncharacterized protein n=1 Tax=Ciona savignyi TaxID=51511 RepID=H2YMY2_CIOSA